MTILKDSIKGDDMYYDRLTQEQVNDLYNRNEDFREYVLKYVRRDGITIEEGLKHAMVWEMAKDIMFRSRY